MDFGKLPSVDHVDFSLAPEPPQNAAVLGGAPASVRLYLGATGYNMRAWVGRWYPSGAPERLFLTYYGKQFNTIEHNTTHYRIPEVKVVLRWRDAVPSDFRFCPKVPQSVSHARSLTDAFEEMERFCRHIEQLQMRLGLCFMQLPPNFEPRRLGEIERFLSAFSARLPLAVEVRHPAFFSDPAATEALFDLLSDKQTAAVITDVAGRRDVCHMRLTTRRTLVRFVGNALHPTDFTRTEQWAERLALWAGQGLEEAYFFCHEPDNLLAPELAAFAAATFRRHLPNAQLRGPVPLSPHAQQMALFE